MKPSILKKVQVSKEKKKVISPIETLSDLYSKDPLEALQSGKIMAKAWVKALNVKEHGPKVYTFMFKVIESYWQVIHENQVPARSLPFMFNKFTFKKLDKAVSSVAEAIGTAAAKINIIEAGFLLGNIYTSLLPEGTRSTGGIFYTPPALSSRLIEISESAGIDWKKSKIIDPACGGGAFLTPVCLKMRDALIEEGKKPKEIIEHIQSHLTGWEIDPFGGWLTQVFVESALKDIIKASEIKLKPLVTICDSLENYSSLNGQFDLVIGNPPYGKLKLSDSIRTAFKDSLYGHPNYYGLFTHLGLNLIKKEGIIAFLTPTSFLSGEYFKNLRLLLRKNTSPVEIDFVSIRKGVFEDVLQETMLAVYKKQVGKTELVKVNQITTLPQGQLNINPAGSFELPKEPTAPWILPRTPQQACSVQKMKSMNMRLKDWGYKISTGPLVWNRHKDQLQNNKKANTYPVIWAESITQDGRFLLKAEKKNHSAYFQFKPGNEWLITTVSCVLLQRTTAKEQDKRLIAAALPETLIQEGKGVVIENHLNMIIPIIKNPLVSLHVLAAFLNSKAVNDAFRTISGSVAVSAFELESLPLPEPEKLSKLSGLIESKADNMTIELECYNIYNI
jgi:adenine-specific DNA-methyltransferase